MKGKQAPTMAREDASMSKAYELGVKRGEATGRSEATDRDYDWIANETGGEIQCTDPQDAVDFEEGMRIGAERSEGSEDERARRAENTYNRR